MEILVNLNKKRDFYNKYSKEKLSNLLSEFIYNESLEGKVGEKIVINIECKEKISNEEKEKMIDMVRRHFGIMVQDLLLTYDKEQSLKAILLVIGIFLILLYYMKIATILKDIILMTGWVSICGSVYGLIFSKTENDIKIKRLKALASARIYFIFNS